MHSTRLTRLDAPTLINPPLQSITDLDRLSTSVNLMLLCTGLIILQAVNFDAIQAELDIAWILSPMTDTSGIQGLMPFWPGNEPLAKIVSDIQPPVRPSSVAQIATQTSKRVHKIWEAAKQDIQPFPRPPSTSGDDEYSPSALSSSPSSSDAEEEVVGSGLPVYPRTANSTGEFAKTCWLASTSPPRACTLLLTYNEL